MEPSLPRGHPEAGDDPAPLIGKPKDDGATRLVELTDAVRLNLALPGNTELLLHFVFNR